MCRDQGGLWKRPTYIYVLCCRDISLFRFLYIAFSFLRCTVSGRRRMFARRVRNIPGLIEKEIRKSRNRVAGLKSNKHWLSLRSRASCLAKLYRTLRSFFVLPSQESSWCTIVIELCILLQCTAKSYNLVYRSVRRVVRRSFPCLRTRQFYTHQQL